MRENNIARWVVLTVSAFLCIAATTFAADSPDRANSGWPLQRTVSDDRQFGAVWSPDGKQIVYEQDFGGSEYIDSTRRTVDWLDKYLKGGTAAEIPAQAGQ